MDVRNFLQAGLTSGPSHRGIGEVRSIMLYNQEDFQSPLRFLYFVEIPPGASIGYHGHKDDEEIYIILSGSGEMTVDGETEIVHAGDTVMNKPYGSHGLFNHTDRELTLLVYEAAVIRQGQGEQG